MAVSQSEAMFEKSCQLTWPQYGIIHDKEVYGYILS